MDNSGPATMDKCCGTCKWWSKKYLSRFGQCDVPIPASCTCDCATLMRENEGTTCPTYQPKEQNDG